jgi:hypothetical protein
MVDSEQTISRRFDVEVPDDGSQDITRKYYDPAKKYRPYRVVITYRVNRGANAPFWYPFTVKVYARRVLVSGQVSVAPPGQLDRTYSLGPTREDDVPGELFRLAQELLPQTAPEV